MRFAIYVKGERGIESLGGLRERNLMPVVCVGEKNERAISDFCTKYQISLLIESHPKKPEHIAHVHSFKPELIVCAGYSRILPEALFAGLPYGAINCHGGRLPEYRGASPIPWQIMNGETYGVAYVLKMTQGVDDGSIVAQARYEIAEQNTARDVTDKVTAIFRRLIPDVVECYAKGSPPEGMLQSEENACHWTRRYPEDGLIEWNRLTTRQVVNFIRALDDPYPGAFLVHKGERLIVRRVRVYAKKMAGVPGRCVGKTKDGVLILAVDGAVEILEFIANGKILLGNEFPAQYGETF